jgi:transposase
MLSGAGIKLSAHGTFSEPCVKSTSDNKKIGHNYTRGNIIIEKMVRRRAILVLTKSEVAPTAITAFIGTSKSSVFRWNNRCAQTNNYKDLPRSGRPPFYTEDIKLKVIAFYCQKRPLPGCGRWSLRWASQHLAANPECIGKDTPSKSTIQRFLVNNKLKPHRSRYFLHITDPDFFPKMEHLVALFKNPPDNLFFFDECPGIQILQRLTPDMQTEETKKRIEEFEYIRNGTMDVFAFFNYTDGKIYAECRCNHKTDTFLEVFKSHVKEQASSEEIHYVMDNLSSHRSYSFCQAVAELSAVQCPAGQELDTLSKRMQWLQMTDKRIIIHFTPYHGSWLNLVEIWFGIMGAKVLGESYNSAENLKASFDSFVIEWNCILAHPFRWSYDGRGLHKRAVVRFKKMLENTVTQMDIRILTKMLMLMTNLLKNYMKEVTEHVWASLTETIFAQYTKINEMIQKEEGPKRKEKAQHALASMMAAIQRYLGYQTTHCKHF